MLKYEGTHSSPAWTFSFSSSSAKACACASRSCVAESSPEGSEGGVLVAAVSNRVLTNLVGLAVSAVGGKDVSTCCVAEVARLVASPNRPLTIQFTQYVKSMAFVPATDVCCLDPVLVGGDVPEGAELGLSLVHE